MGAPVSALNRTVSSVVQPDSRRSESIGFFSCAARPAVGSSSRQPEHRAPSPRFIEQENGALLLAFLDRFALDMSCI